VGGLPANRTVNGFAVNPADPKVMYAAMRDGLFQSTDGGENWQRIGNPLRNLVAVAVNPKDTNVVFTATMDGTIFRSQDAGKTWERRK
jgi:photosystem II stability/assembly factor-like uncharacterized protein